MSHIKARKPHVALDTASLMRGVYARVSVKAGCDPSYVSRVARSERRSRKVEVALTKELERILRKMGGKFKVRG